MYVSAGGWLWDSRCAVMNGSRDRSNWRACRQHVRRLQARDGEMCRCQWGGSHLGAEDALAVCRIALLDANPFAGATRTRLLARHDRAKYPSGVDETTSTGLGSPKALADNRRRAVFLRPRIKHSSFQWAGLGGEGFGPAGANVPVFLPRQVPAHPIRKWEAGFNPNVGGRNMRRIPARSEQTQSLIQGFPLFARAGREAADLWLTAAPLSMGAFRDLRFRNLISGMSFDDIETRRTAFNNAFGLGIANAIVATSHAEVRHV
jgi:hypothetical protein